VQSPPWFSSAEQDASSAWSEQSCLYLDFLGAQAPKILLFPNTHSSFCFLHTLLLRSSQIFSLVVGVAEGEAEGDAEGDFVGALLPLPTVGSPVR